MNRRFIYSMLILLCPLLTMLLAAQDDLAETVTFNGYTLRYPTGWQILDQEYSIALAGDNELVIVMLPDELESFGVPFEDDLETALTIAAKEALGQGEAPESLEFGEIGGREAAWFEFVEDNGDRSFIVMVRLSDGKIAALGAASREAEQVLDTETILAIAGTLDLSEKRKPPIPELTNTVTFTSGVSFGYTDFWQYEETEPAATFVVLNAPDFRSYVQVYDLAALFEGMTFDMQFYIDTYAESAHTTWGGEFAAEQLEMIDFDGREAAVYRFVGEQNEEAAHVIVVITTLSNGQYGMVTAYSLGTPPESYESDVVAIARSVDIEGETDDVGNTPADEWTRDQDFSGVTLAVLNGVSQQTPYTVKDFANLYGNDTFDLGFFIETYANEAHTEWGGTFDTGNITHTDYKDRATALYKFDGESEDGLVEAIVVVMQLSEDWYGLVVASSLGAQEISYEDDLLELAFALDAEALMEE